MNKAQTYSLYDQRGKIDSKNLEIPDFLLTNASSLVIKSQNQSLSQSFNQSINSNYSKINDFSMQKNISGNNKSVLMSISSSMTSLPVVSYGSSKTINQNSPRSRSPIVIVYDYEDVDSITENIANGTNQTDHINTQTPTKQTNTACSLNNSQISYS